MFENSISSTISFDEQVNQMGIQRACFDSLSFSSSSSFVSKQRKQQQQVLKVGKQWNCSI